MASQGCILCLGLSRTLASAGLRCCCAWDRQKGEKGPPPLLPTASTTALLSTRNPLLSFTHTAPSNHPKRVKHCGSVKPLGVGPCACSQPLKQLEISLIYSHSLTLPLVFFHFIMHGKTLVSNLPLPRPVTVRRSTAKPSTKVRRFEYFKYPHPSQRLSVNMPCGKASTDAWTLLNIRLRHDFKRANITT